MFPVVFDKSLRNDRVVQSSCRKIPPRSRRRIQIVLHEYVEVSAVSPFSLWIAQRHRILRTADGTDSARAMSCGSAAIVLVRTPAAGSYCSFSAYRSEALGNTFTYDPFALLNRGNYLSRQTGVLPCSGSYPRIARRDEPQLAAQINRVSSHIRLTPSPPGRTVAGVVRHYRKLPLIAE